MQFGVSLPNFSRLGTRDIVVDLAHQAEALGYDSIWTTDHVMMAKGQDEPYGHVLEALTTLTYVAPLTQRVRLGVSVLVLPQRSPVVVAKEIATLDVLSGGRLILGLGAGWNEREFQFLGASFHDRGRRLNEYITMFRELWTSPQPRFEGQFVQFADVLFSPRPVQPDGPPIWIGGGSRAALRRAATLADGWQSTGVGPERYAESMRQLREMANSREVVGSLRISTAVGRTLPEVRGASGQVMTTLCGSREQVIDRIREYEAGGMTYLVTQFGTDSREVVLEDMRRFADEVRPAFT